MTIYFSAPTDERSGEHLSMAQLARAAGATLVPDVPPDGALLYVVNLNIRAGLDDLAALRARRGPTAYLVGVLRGAEERETWRPYFEELKRSARAFFVHHPAQVEYLRAYGIAANLVPLWEDRFGGGNRVQAGTVLYTGFYWPEKDLRMVEAVARLLPDRRFVLQIGMDVEIDVSLLPENLELRGGFLPVPAYRALLSSCEYIWIPRKASTWVYAGKSALTAVASGRPTLLSDVLPHATIPRAAALFYPTDWPAERIAELLASRPAPDPSAVAALLDEVAPARVWARIRAAFLEPPA